MQITHRNICIHGANTPHPPATAAKANTREPSTELLLHTDEQLSGGCGCLSKRPACAGIG
ncbi:hypothetical protein T10_11442 [Trichinella papuae]|uniref:Uncharacterized protein n=1 Tax=Trichinella papuae TaxID=268474 RepID=A0A0V1M4U1_9BILA|nr:hypothetical protein T10_11442 [Trichinella papuae]